MKGFKQGDVIKVLTSLRKPPFMLFGEVIGVVTMEAERPERRFRLVHGNDDSNNVVGVEMDKNVYL